MSVLVPGQDPLEHRAAYDQRRFDLLEWLHAVELDAWTRIRTYYPQQNPQNIFIVTGCKGTSPNVTALF